MSLVTVRDGIRNCTSCPLHSTRIKAVPGEGPLSAKIAFLGEAPGWQEDKTGRPWVGQAGKRLDECLESIGLNRPQIYLCNVINCRPPNNRDPKISELESCSHWIQDQLSLLTKLEIIVSLGRYASLALFPGEKPANIRGKARYVNGKIHIFCLHPAATLHNPNSLPELQESFRLLGTFL